MKILLSKTYGRGDSGVLHVWTNGQYHPAMGFTLDNEGDKLTVRVVISHPPRCAPLYYLHVYTLCTRFAHVLKMPINLCCYWLCTLHTLVFYILHVYRYPHKIQKKGGYRGIYIKEIGRFFACKCVTPCRYWLYGIFYACGIVLFWEVKCAA